MSSAMPCDVRGLPGVVDGQVRRADDVLEDRSGEDARVLDHYAELAADGTGIELGQALAVVGDRSRLRALEPEQEAKDR